MANKVEEFPVSTKIDTLMNVMYEIIEAKNK